MSRKYSSWASNRSHINPDLTMMKLTTVTGNEQDQLKNLERVEAIPHMYINVDAPPPPTTIIDTRALQQPSMLSRQNSSFFAAPTLPSTSTNAQTRIWPVEKTSKNASPFEGASSSSKRAHKHKNHHHRHHHHGDKHHHHHSHSRHRRATSAESIRNRQHQAFISPNKIVVTNPQYIEQDQQQQQQQYQQQQQPMIVYREVPNGEGYTVDTNNLATVPYETQNETAFVDDQQAPLFVYRDGNFYQQPQSILTDGITQPLFINQDQEANIMKQNTPLQSIENKLISSRGVSLNETQVGNYSPLICSQPSLLMNPNRSVNTGYIQEIERIYIEDDCCLPSSTINCVSESCIIQQNDPFVCLSQQQQQPQYVYCADPNPQDYFCTSTNNNIIQQNLAPQQQQQQFVCVDNLPTTIQPTIINQIPVFNALSANTASQGVISVPQAQLQRATSVIIQQPQHQPQQLQIIQQPQPLQVIQQPQPLQVIQQPQSLQFIQNPQSGQFLQLASATPQVIQAQPVLQTIQVPTQTVAANPQILYQRPYDPIAVPIQNQQVALASPSLAALSQPSYAPSRIMPATGGTQSPGPNMFRHALLRTVAGRAGVPLPATSTGVGGIQLMQPTAAGSLAANPSFLIAGGTQRSSSLPIVPLTPGGLLIPFQPSQTPGLISGPLPRAGGYPSNLRNFNDIRQQIQQQRAQLAQALQQSSPRRVPSPPVISAAPRSQPASYTSGNIFGSGARSTGVSLPPLMPSSYNRLPSTGPSYAQPSFAGSNSGSASSGPSNSPYNPLRPYNT